MYLLTVLKAKSPRPRSHWIQFLIRTLFLALWKFSSDWIKAALTARRWPGTHSQVTTFSQFSHSVVSNSLQTHGPQHARPPCPSPTPRVYPNSGPLSQWCHPTISSSVIPFSSCPQSFPASGSFPKSQLFVSGGQSIGVSPSTSVLPINTQDWISFRMDWLDLLAVQGTLKSLLQHHSSKASILWCSTSCIV